MKMCVDPDKIYDLCYDLCIVGGGINGAGIARDAAMRGLSVLLLEAQDLAGATSSASTKLIHGGLRYLEHYEFKLVREALKERETLLNLAPHIIWPMQFVLPHDRSQRPAWLIRMGLFLYDNLAKRKKLRPSKGVNLSIEPYGEALDDRYKKGFSYSDCWVEDARLVVLNAMDARKNGADILTRTACTNIAPNGDCWNIQMRDLRNNRDHTARAKRVINAGGPWVRNILNGSNLVTEDTPNIRLVQGSHIVVKKLYEGAHSYILQQADGRIVFAIPYEHNYTLIGTTDQDYHGDPTNVAITDAEVSYLCNAINTSFKSQITAADVIWSYSGVRPLMDDGEDAASAVTRDYKVILDHFGDDDLPVLSVFGGKITTYRTLAKEALDTLLEKEGLHLPCKTNAAPLPGGDIDNADFERFAREKCDQYDYLPDAYITRLCRAYGTNIAKILNGVNSKRNMGKHYGENIYRREIKYLVEHEWAETLDDILLRRSKLGLHLNAKTIKNIEDDLPKLLRDINT